MAPIRPGRTEDVILRWSWSALFQTPGAGYAGRLPRCRRPIGGCVARPLLARPVHLAPEPRGISDARALPLPRKPACAPASAGHTSSRASCPRARGASSASRRPYLNSNLNPATKRRPRTSNSPRLVGWNPQVLVYTATGGARLSRFCTFRKSCIESSPRRPSV